LIIDGCNKQADARLALVTRGMTAVADEARKGILDRDSAKEKNMSERIAQALKKNTWIWLVAAFSILIAVGIATS